VKQLIAPDFFLNLLLWRTGDIFNGVSDGSLKVRVDRTYPPKEAAEAHHEREARQTAGKVLLLP
jgi:NADPH:quinone reductase